jgi:UDP-N-acetylmuramate dehydrogenase
MGSAPLAGYTTLGLGGPAATLTESDREAGLVSAVRHADERGEPVLVLGGGSNVVIADEGFPGLVVRVATRGMSFASADPGNPAGRVGPVGRAGPAGPAGRAGPAGPARPSKAGSASVALTVAAGENWDDVVARCVAEGLAGLECLSGIPGLAGATPIQNVGAYGQEVADTITSVRVYDRQQRRVTEMPAAACGFGYRTSFFKRTPFAPGAATGRFVVLTVTFRLTPGPRSGPQSAPIRYPELGTELGVAPGDRVPLGETRSAVLKLRARKGMVLEAGDPDTRSAGSFFTNPVLTTGEFAAVTRRARQSMGPRDPGLRVVPHFPAPDGHVKVPAAWLIEHSGFGKGYAGQTGGPSGPGAARISSKHTLALVNPGAASTASLLALAREIRAGVRDAFGVTLDIEPVLVGISA